jgi:ribosome-binding protein aMBF1 (putative translation factor)
MKMIANARQYVITKAAADKFRRAIEATTAAPLAPGQRKAARAAELASLADQLNVLEAQLRQYDAMADRKVEGPLTGHLSDLGTLLVQARIARGLTQRELGDQLGMKMQQVQRYEATRYASASLSRILTIAQALRVRVDLGVHVLEVPDLKAWKRDRVTAGSAT